MTCPNCKKTLEPEAVMKNTGGYFSKGKYVPDVFCWCIYCKTELDPRELSLTGTYDPAADAIIDAQTGERFTVTSHPSS